MCSFLHLAGVTPHPSLPLKGGEGMIFIEPTVPYERDTPYRGRSPASVMRCMMRRWP